MTKRTFVPRASTAVVTYEGKEHFSTSGKDNTLIVAPDGKVGIGGPREGKYRTPVGIPVDPSEWCEPSHEFCDLNVANTVPNEIVVEWRYGILPVTTRERPRVTRYCLACFEAAHERGDNLEDWGAVLALRAEASEPAHV